MRTFKSFINEAEVNTHLQHIEQLVFDLGVEGTRRAIFFLRDVRDMLTQGSGNKKGVITVKWDGAPAVFMGINPENGKFFVAKKGLFNKNPKLYYSHADIEADTAGDLARKLKVAFDEGSKLGITKGVYQGDIMFTKEDLKVENINGTKYVTFHPNTIVYAVPTDSALAKKIQKSNIGIVWHTTYEGESITSLKTSFGHDIVSKFRKTNTSWMENATFTDASGVANFTDNERKEFDSLLSDIGRLFQQMPAQTLNSIHKDNDLLMLVHTYNNAKIKANQRLSLAGISAHVDGLYDYIDNRYSEEKHKKKTQVAKDRTDDKRKKILNFFLVHPKNQIEAIFELSLRIAEAKEMLVRKLNSATQTNTFLKTKDGFRVTTPEGFVAISDQGATKLVDRFEFSLANFSPDIIKGWQR